MKILINLLSSFNFYSLLQDMRVLAEKDNVQQRGGRLQSRRKRWATTMGGNVGEDGSGGGSEGGRQWASGKRRERMTVLAVEGWGEAVVVMKKAGGGEEDGGRRLFAREGSCIILSHC